MERVEFENIVKQIRPLLKNKAQSILQDDDVADDVVQDALLKLWAMRNDLDAYKSVEGLAIVITQRLALDVLKLRRCDTYCGEELSEYEESPFDEYVRKESEKRVDVILSKLPDRQSAILRMKHVDCLETKEIAKILGITESAVRITLMRARNKVKELFMNK